MTRGREIQGVSSAAEIVVVATSSGPDGPTALLPVGALASGVTTPAADRGRHREGAVDTLSRSEVPLVRRLLAELRGAGATGPVTLVGDPSVGAAVPDLDAVPATTACEVLERLAEAAARSDADALVVVPGDLLVDSVALLGLLDHPGRRTAAYVVPSRRGDTGGRRGADDATIAVRRHGSPAVIASVGTAVHDVSAPDTAALGIVRVDARDRRQAAELWRQAAAAASARGWQADPLALALLALVRGGVTVSAVDFGRYPWARPRRGEEAARASQELAGTDSWRLRLAQASRPDDGFYSTFAVRPLSRRLTGLALRLGIAPNTVTVVSLVAGVVGALLVLQGSHAAFVASAVLLQASLVIDCVDGEIARFTRRFSSFGAWLDATGDRVKEYALYATLAVVGSTAERSLWPLAAVVMAVVAYRHFADYAYGATTRAALVPRAHLAPVEVPHDGDPDAPAGDRSLPRAVARRHSNPHSGAVHWAKKVVHMPIGERYLLLSLLLLSGSPRVVLWTMLAVIAASIVYTTGGRTIRTVLERMPYRTRFPDGWSELDHETDLGPLARAVGPVAGLPFLLVWLGLLLPVPALVLLAGEATEARAVLLAASVLCAAAVLGAALRPGSEAPLLWEVPGLIWVLEAAVLVVVQRAFAPDSGPLVFGLLAVLAYHRYDAIYRMRDTGRPPAPALTRAGLGVDGRLLLVTTVAWLAPDALPAVLAVLAGWLTVLYLGESAVFWTRWLRPATRHS
jgi:hypothetical protein